MSETAPQEYALRLASVKQQLLQLFSPKEADEWLHYEHSLLQGRRPIDLLESDLGYLEVSSMIHRVLDGAFI